MRQIGRYTLRIINRSPFKFKHFFIFLLVLLAHWALISVSAKLHVLPDTGKNQAAVVSVQKSACMISRDGFRQKVFDLLKGNDGKSEVRLYAVALEIASLGDCAFEPLLEALHDKNMTVRAIAAETLGEIGDKRAVEPLIDALKDSSSLVREKAADALGELGDIRAVEPLIKAIDDKDLKVCYQAEKSLGKLGDRRAAAPLIKALKDKERGYYAAEALVELNDPQSAKPILELISNGKIDAFIESELLELAVKAGKPATDYLIKSLRSADKEKRTMAVRSLYALQVPEAVEPLISMLDSDDFDIWLSAIYTLGSYENAAVREKLFSVMQSSEGRKKLGVACALGLMKDERATACILESIDLFDFSVGYSPRVEQNALKAIGSKAVPQMIAAMRSGSSETRRSVIDILPECLSGRELEKILINALKDEDSSVRFNAALGLGDCASTDSTLPLIDAAGDGDSFVNGSAIRALGETGDSRAFDVLMSYLQDPDKEKREDAIWALGKLKDKRAVKPLSTLLESDDIKVYSRAAYALAEIGDTAFVPRLMEKIKKQQWDDEKTGRDIRRDNMDWLARALVTTGRASTGQIISLLKADSWQAHYIAGSALGEIDDPAARAELMKAFNERRLDVIAGAMNYFIRRGIPGSEPVLAMALDEYSDFYMTGSCLNCGSRKMKKTALLDTVKKYYCGHCMKGVRGCIWHDNVPDNAPPDIKVFSYALASLSPPEK